MRGVWSTLALVAVAVGLGAYIYFIEFERPTGEVKEKLFTVAADDIEELRVTAKGETAVLKKADGGIRQRFLGFLVANPTGKRQHLCLGLDKQTKDEDPGKNESNGHFSNFKGTAL